MKTKKTAITEQKTLQQFIDYYELCNRAEDKSPRTIDWYTHNLNYFCNYLKSKKLPDTLDKIDINTLRQYILHLLKKNKYAGHPSCPEQHVPVSSSTVHGHVRTRMKPTTTAQTWGSLSSHAYDYLIPFSFSIK